MNKVALTLQSEDTSAEDLEKLLDSLRPILALATSAVAHTIIIREDDDQAPHDELLPAPPHRYHPDPRD